MSFTTPHDLRYLESHEWVRVEDNDVVIGITDFAQHELGDIVYIELPNVGDSFGPEEVFGVIESVKASSDLFTPVGGEVVAINTALTDDQTPITQDPYGAGWLIRLKPSGQEGNLLDAAAYEELVASQQH